MGKTFVLQNTAYPIIPGRKIDGKDIHVGSVLPERAPSEGPRSTGAPKPTWTPFLVWENERAWKDHLEG